jgi:hypothetical protein
MAGSHHSGCKRQNKSPKGGSIMLSANRQPVETKRYTLAELYELRRVIIKHSRSMPLGPGRNEYRKIASSMRFLSRDRKWLAVHTIGRPENGIED